MPKVSDEHRAMRTREIVEAAHRAFARKGFHAASMADIIAEAGLSAGAIYGHFDSKADLVQAVAGSVLQLRLEQVVELGESEPPQPPGVLVATFARGLLDGIPQPGVAVQVWGEAMVDDRLRETAEGIFTRVIGALATHVERWCLARGDDADEAARLAERHAPLLAALVQGYMLQRALLPGFDADAYLAAVEDYEVR